MKQNHYKVLGLKDGAPLHQVRAAYRRLAKEFHPDHYGCDSEPFLRIQDAYSVLSNPRTKQAYDQSLRDTDDSIRVQTRSARRNPSQRPFAEPLSPHDTSYDTHPHSLSSGLFPRAERVLGMGAPNRHVAPFSFTRTVDVSISPDLARNGGRIPLTLVIPRTCPQCRGWNVGGLWGCGRCEGRGVVEDTVELQADIPAGIQPGQTGVVEVPGPGGESVRLTVRFQVVRCRTIVV